MKRKGLAALIAAFGMASGAWGTGSFDYGQIRDLILNLNSYPLFGVLGTVPASSTASIDAATAEANPAALVTLAPGLKARAVASSASLGANVDMIALWPDDSSPTHLIVCNEQGTADPAMQRIRISDGGVETILTGMSSCDPVTRSAWGTIVFAEEAGTSGTLLEMANPLAVTGVSFDRVTGTVSNGATGTGAENVAVRYAVGRTSFEGLALLPNGVLYYGDENRPSTGTAGGAYFKFIPTNPYAGAPIASLDQSPLASGRVFGLRLGKRSGNTDYGQGSNTGKGVWVEVTPAYNANLRAAAATLKLTGYYRPEDAAYDPAAWSAGKVRFCAINTGNEGADSNWGEAICVTDGTIAESLANTATPELQLFVVGTSELAMPDNIAYQPVRRNWIIHEDGDGPEVGRNNDLWSCLEDRGDVDTLSDGCIRVATLNDLNAEWTGGVFDATGKRFFVSLQHNVTGHGVVLEITGWR